MLQQSFSESQWEPRENSAFQEERESNIWPQWGLNVQPTITSGLTIFDKDFFGEHNKHK